jgi:hypothetical protein
MSANPRYAPTPLKQQRRERLLGLFGDALRNGAIFSTVGDTDHHVSAHRAVIAIKHDVHALGLDGLIEFARQEKQLGVVATYFFMAPDHPATLPAYTYGEQSEAMREVAALGHQIGLHLDPYFLITSLGEPLAERILACQDRFAGSGINVTVGNMHGHTGHKHPDNQGYGTSFDLFDEIGRQPDYPALRDVPEASAELVRRNRTSLLKLGFTHWADMPLWSARHGYVHTGFVSDNYLGKQNLIEVLLPAETRGRYGLSAYQPPGSRRRAADARYENADNLAIADNTAIATKLDFDSDAFGQLFGAARTSLMPAQLLIHPEFYC